jgi:Concanavalin A-like lectin/glucanases superfamily
MGVLRIILVGLLLVGSSFIPPNIQRDKDLVLHLDLRKSQGKMPQDETNINYCIGRGTTISHLNNGYTFTTAGTDEVDCGARSPLNLTTQCTISAWIYMGATAAAIGKQTSGASGFAYYIAYNSDRKVYFQMTGNGTTVAYGASQTLYTRDRWIQVTCTYNGAGATNADKLKIYYDGVFISSMAFVGTIPSSIFVSTANLRVNVHNGTTYGAGKYGLIRLFKRCMTATEVMSEYVNTKATNK